MKKIPAHDHLGLAVVVTDRDGRPLTKTDATRIPSQLKETLNFGSIVSSKNKESPLQQFFCLDGLAYDTLCKKYADGLPVTKDYANEIDKVVGAHGTRSYSLVSTDKIVSPSTSLNEGFHWFTRQFAGDSAPSVDDSFQHIYAVDGLIIHHKIVSAREYSQFSPLSIGMFHSAFHGIQINQDYINLLENATGSRGSYEGGREAMNHRGYLSYTGPRKKGNMCQPNATEGPKIDGLHDSENYWFHNKKMKHVYWPFLLSLFNLIVGSTTLAPYYIYHHLSKLYPILNSSKERKKFCPRGILTINFCSSCHSDKSDSENNHIVGNMKERVKGIIDKFSELRSEGVHFEESRETEAIESLKHILWWGVCLPTTCCYQYITKDKTHVEVYQWFMCPGLGTTYLIRNYWVHLMLAALFSHCTSAPIYIVEGRAYFGKCPKVTMFAWGGS